MQIIPVIDLKDGVVVRARQGDRASYRPIETPLSPTADPLDVTAGLVALHAFRTLYVADLDAIEGRGDHGAALAGIGARFPRLELWVDNGCRDGDAAERFFAANPAASLVLGSESQADARLAKALQDHGRAVLSLDFRAEGFVGPAPLLADASAWPRRVILMTLARVGSDAGPDLARLEAIRRRAGAREIFAAGGVRGPEDLRALENAGAAGVLVASALHDGRLARNELARLAAPSGHDRPRDGPR